MTHRWPPPPSGDRAAPVSDGTPTPRETPSWQARGATETSSLRGLVRSDLARFTQTYALRGQAFSRRRVFWESVIFKGGFQAVALYRVSHWLYQRNRIYLAWMCSRLNAAVTGAEIEFNARIGPGMLIAHPVGIVIGRGTVIGSDVTLFQGVTLGVSGWRKDQIHEFPTVGNRCFFFAGSAVLGGVTIGDECVIGAHAVVASDMADGAMAVGVRATVHPNRGSDVVANWRA